MTTHAQNRGEALRQQRVEFGLTIKQAAEKIGCPRATLEMIEKGDPDGAMDETVFDEAVDFVNAAWESLRTLAADIKEISELIPFLSVESREMFVRMIRAEAQQDGESVIPDGLTPTPDLGWVFGRNLAAIDQMTRNMATMGRDGEQRIVEARRRLPADIEHKGIESMDRVSLWARTDTLRVAANRTAGAAYPEFDDGLPADPVAFGAVCVAFRAVSLAGTASGDGPFTTTQLRVLLRPMADAGLLDDNIIRL